MGMCESESDGEGGRGGRDVVVFNVSWGCARPSSVNARLIASSDNLHEAWRLWPQPSALKD